jgi:hypothetical protein
VNRAALAVFLVRTFQPTGLAITIDNTSTTSFTKNGTWKPSTHTPGYHGSDYLHDNSSAASPGKWARWTPNIPKNAFYDIYMKWPSAANRPDAAPLEIKHSGGIDTGQKADQKDTVNNGEWRLIGTYFLTAGSENYVMIKGDDLGYTIADAVKFD